MLDATAPKAYSPIDSFKLFTLTCSAPPVMTALGLAGTANIFMDGMLKREATKWYLDALKMTNKALARPIEAKSDSILLATMLLSVFEATNNEKTFNGWLEHVSGSASLVRMRGRSQFETPAGRRMYMQTVGLLAVFCNIILL